MSPPDFAGGPTAGAGTRAIPSPRDGRSHDAAPATGTGAASYVARIGTGPRSTGRRLRGVIARHLGSAIVSGEYRPGDVLPSETEGAATLEVSRGAYREAIRTLAAKGLVDSRPRSGTTVQPRRRWNLLDPEVLDWTFSGEPDMSAVRSLLELRTMVEPWAASIAAERRTRADLTAMRDALAAMARHGLDHAMGQAADGAFHDAILKATGNDYLATMATGIGTAVEMTSRFRQRSRALPRDPIPGHRQVLNAIVAQDAAGAATAMRSLVDQAFDDVRPALA